jgi:3D (Asp-Asp-Asp) domain-containing protein
MRKKQTNNKEKLLMIQSARRSLFFSATMFFAALFCFQLDAEAKSTFNIASDSQKNFNKKEFIHPENRIKRNINPQTSIQKLSDNSENNLENELEGAIKVTNSYRATAYCLKGRTASGGGVRRGIVAADPRHLPLGTRIQLTAGSYTGTYTVADTGGAVKGRILDIWMPSCVEAVRFGRKTVGVSVVGRR